MRAKIVSTKDCKALIEIEVPSDEVERKFIEVYKEIRKVADVPGFRVGKAPQDIIEKKYKTQATEEVLKDLISTSYEDAIKSLNILPIELPKIMDVKFDREKPLTYKAEVNIKPEIKLKKYKGLKINKRKPKVEDSDVEKTLSNLQHLHAKFISKDTHNVAGGDYVVCDLACLSSGKEIFKREAMWLSAGDETGIKELHQGIIGMKKDEAKEIPAKLPSEYPDETLKGKDVVYKVKINHIKEKKLPLLDDDFAKDLGKSTLQELKSSVKKDLIKRTELAINEDVRRQIIEQILKDSSCQPPESMVDKYLESLVNDAKERLRAQGLKEGDIESNTSNIQQKLRPQAISQVKVFFLLEKIANLENIKVSPSEVDEAIELIANQLKKDKKRLLEEYEEKNLLQHLIGQIREEKTVEFLVKEADVVEK